MKIQTLRDFLLNKNHNVNSNYRTECATIFSDLLRNLELGKVLLDESYVVGSNMFHWAENTRDLDIVLNYDKNLVNSLLDALYEWGWSNIHINAKENYMDSECVFIVSLKFPNREILPAIDFIFRKDKEFYKNCLENVSFEFYEKFLWKSNPSGKVTKELVKQRFEDIFQVGRGIHAHRQ